MSPHFVLEFSYHFWYENHREAPSRFCLRIAIGACPVREWIRSLDAADRKIIGEDIKDVEFSWPMGMPLVRALGTSLWEVRSTLTQGRIARVRFTIDEGRMVLLHGFIKKTEKTAQHDLNLALKRKREIT